MIEKIPAKLLSRMLFLPENLYNEPEHFRTMKAKERIKLWHSFKDLSQEPSETNHWVWFGEFRAPLYAPISGKDLVLRTLYNIFIAPLDKSQRLTNNLGKFYSDVNPFNALPATRLTYVPKGNQRTLDLRKPLKTPKVYETPQTQPLPKQEPSLILPVLPPQEELGELFDSNTNTDPIQVERAIRAIKEDGWNADFLLMAIDHYKNSEEFDEPTVRKAFKELYHENNN